MGGNGVEIHKNFEHNKCDKGCLGGNDDQISKLPEDILVAIVSCLSLKDAGRTSVLSSRWKNLWKHSRCLKFEADSLLYKIWEYHSSQDLVEIEGPKYVEWVNSVIQSHKLPTLKEFKIHFHLSSKDTKEITRWLDFAFSKQVERLELNHENFISPDTFYCFPEPVKSQPHRPVNYYKSLKALTFDRVHVTDGVAEFFLRNCPQLEELTVRRSRKFSNLEVCGSSLVLKHLDLTYSYDFKSLKVCAPCLTSLKVPTIKGLLLENVPMLVDLSVTCYAVERLISALSCYFFQLEVLCVTLLTVTRKGESELGSNYPEMPKLKKLTVDCEDCGYESIIKVIAALIRASPQLVEFVFQYNDYPPSTSKDGGVEDWMRFPNHHLKVFTLCCQYCRTSDVMVEMVVRNCTALEKIIFDTSGGYFPIKERHKIARRRRAKQQLEPQIPHHIEFVVL